jgi:hypothetical protein
VIRSSFEPGLDRRRKQTGSFGLMALLAIGMDLDAHALSLS